MKEIKCPKCGQVFDLSETDVNDIISQIRNHDFNDQVEKEVKKQIELVTKEKEIENEKRAQEQEIENQKEIAKLKEELTKLQAEKDSSENEKKLAVIEEAQKHDVEKETLKKQISDLEAKLSNADKDKDIAVMAKEKELQESITGLMNQVHNFEQTKELAIVKAKEELNQQIADLKQQNEVERRTAQEQLKQKDDIISLYKDMKAQLSTKAIGESLEQYCYNEFNGYRQLFPKTVYFEKDNAVSESGSKGDFIYRETDENGVELLSIMFEMKNENEETKTKHKNEDFFKELDKDRKEKKCEYAVLVSLLEKDNDFYNKGIADVSTQLYDKMYVVRPQCFMTIISILRNAAHNTLKYKRELQLRDMQEIDVKNFENNLNEFKEKFGKNYQSAHTHFENTIEEIDKSIDHLQKVKDELLRTDNQLRLANDKASDITIKKLTKGNPTMMKKFEDVQNDESDVAEDSIEYNYFEQEEIIQMRNSEELFETINNDDNDNEYKYDTNTLNRNEINDQNTCDMKNYPFKLEKTEVRNELTIGEELDLVYDEDKTMIFVYRNGERIGNMKVNNSKEIYAEGYKKGVINGIGTSNVSLMVK